MQGALSVATFIGAVCLVFGFAPQEWLANNLWLSVPDWLAHPTTRIVIIIVGLLLIGTIALWKPSQARLPTASPQTRRSPISPQTSALNDYEKQRAKEARIKVDGYERLILEGRNLFKQSVRSHADYEGWKAKFLAWLERAGDFIQSQDVHSAAGHFKRGSSMLLSPSLSDSFSSEHDGNRTVLSHKLDDLTRRLEWAKDNPYWQPTAEQASKSAVTWATRDRIELYDLACLLAHRPLQSPFEEPQRSYHRRLKDAVSDGKLTVAEMRGTEPNTLTLVMRDDLRIFAKASKDEELLAFLQKWDSLNPTNRKRKNSKRQTPQR